MFSEATLELLTKEFANIVAPYSFENMDLDIFSDVVLMLLRQATSYEDFISDFDTCTQDIFVDESHQFVNALIQWLKDQEAKVASANPQATTETQQPTASPQEINSSPKNDIENVSRSVRHAESSSDPFTAKYLQTQGIDSPIADDASSQHEEKLDNFPISKPKSQLLRGSQTNGMLRRMQEVLSPVSRPVQPTTHHDIVSPTEADSKSIPNNFFRNIAPKKLHVVKRTEKEESTPVIAPSASSSDPSALPTEATGTVNPNQAAPPSPSTRRRVVVVKRRAEVEDTSADNTSDKSRDDHRYNSQPSKKHKDNYSREYDDSQAQSQAQYHPGLEPVPSSRHAPIDTNNTSTALYLSYVPSMAIDMLDAFYRQVYPQEYVDIRPKPNSKILQPSTNSYTINCFVNFSTPDAVTKILHERLQFPTIPDNPYAFSQVKVVRARPAKQQNQSQNQPQLHPHGELKPVNPQDNNNNNNNNNYNNTNANMIAPTDMQQQLLYMQQMMQQQLQNMYGYNPKHTSKYQKKTDYNKSHASSETGETNPSGKPSRPSKYKANNDIAAAESSVSDSGDVTEKITSLETRMTELKQKIKEQTGNTEKQALFLEMGRLKKELNQLKASTTTN